MERSGTDYKNRDIRVIKFNFQVCFNQIRISDNTIHWRIGSTTEKQNSQFLKLNGTERNNGININGINNLHSAPDRSVMIVIRRIN